MSREIKFRAWDKYDCMFRDVVRIDYNSGKVEARWEEGDAPKVAGGFFAKGIKLLDMDALVEFTGLHDKNGKEIYEGDIVLIRTHNPYFMRDECVKEELAIVIYLDIRMAFEYQIIKTRFPNVSEDENDSFRTVIGNIHENPELSEA